MLVSKSKEEYYFTKNNPYLPLGNLQYQLNVEGHVENPKPFFRMYGNAYAPPEPVVEESPKEAPKNHVKMEVEQQAGEFTDGQINCPICTFYNAITNTHCEVCGSALNEA